MKSKRQRQQEALERLEENLRFWEKMSQTGKAPDNYLFTPSNKDVIFYGLYAMNRGATAIDLRKALAERKIKSLTRNITNLRKKLSY